MCQNETKSNLRQLNEQSELSIQNTYDPAGKLIADADAEIGRIRQILAAIDELEVEFEKIRHIRDIVQAFRKRVDKITRKVS
jgi:hypothetical protein